MQTVLFYTHYALLLLFGILLTVSFAGIRLSDRRSILIVVSAVALSGILQFICYALLGIDAMWRLYPAITHLPLLLVLLIFFRLRFIQAAAAVTTAYLCCQPAKWFGILVLTLGGSTEEEFLIRIIVLLATAYFVLRYMAPGISEIYNKDDRSVLIFSLVPDVYYLFDYTMNIFSSLWVSDKGVAREFLPFMLCLVHLIFCLIYYREYEQKADMERRENILNLTLDQQRKEIDAVKRSERELRILRHDLKHFLTSLSACIEEDDKETARSLVAQYTGQVDATAIQRYCTNDTVNYTLSDFAERCNAQNVKFEPDVRLGDELPDLIMFTAILSNALDNALRAQAEVPEGKRYVRLMLKSTEKKTLLSVKNPTPYTILFIDGLPVSGRKGHGYGTQSIRYLAERLGGNCQFTADNGVFTVRVVI